MITSKSLFLFLQLNFQDHQSNSCEIQVHYLIYHFVILISDSHIFESLTFALLIHNFKIFSLAKVFSIHLKYI